MELTDSFEKDPIESSSGDNTVPVERISYDIAYFILPQYVFQTLDRIIEVCTSTPSMAGLFYYIMACQSREIEPDIEAARKFQWHAGDFDGRKYLALEYPSPTPVDMGDSDPITLLQSGVKIVLAPYFSLILYGDDAPPDYYILGQAPLGGGTTVRTITAEGMNCNLGPGPEPTLEMFFEAIRERRSGTAN